MAGAAAALALSGCSYLTMDRPPKAVRRGDLFPACSTERTYPYVDLALTAAAVVSAGAFYAGFGSVDDEDAPMMKRELSSGERVVAGTVALLQGGLFALSASWGFDQSARCRALQPQLLEPQWQSQPPPQPQWQPQPPPQPPQPPPQPGGAP